MLSDRLFQLTFLISLITHGIILLSPPEWNISSKAKKAQNLEIKYIKSRQDAQEPLLKSLPKIRTARKIPPQFLDQEKFFQKSNKEIALSKSEFLKPLRQRQEFAKPTFIKPDIIDVKKKITLPAVDTDKIEDPSYLSYYQIVREKIRRAAYQLYGRPETGEIYLSFIISSEGYLKELRIFDERSSPNLYLKEIATQSLKEASPFPNFPKELDYPQLSFNIIISFEIK